MCDFSILTARSVRFTAYGVLLWIITFGLLFIACLMLAISPGAGAINSMSIAMKYGLKTSLIANLGLQCGNVFNISVVGMGLGALLVKSEVLFSLIKWVGVGYLIYLGIKKFKELPELADKAESINTQSSSKLFFNRYWSTSLTQKVSFFDCTVTAVYCSYILLSRAITDIRYDLDSH